MGLVVRVGRTLSDIHRHYSAAKGTNAAVSLYPIITFIIIYVIFIALFLIFKKLTCNLLKIYSNLCAFNFFKKRHGIVLKC